MQVATTTATAADEDAKAEKAEKKDAKAAKKAQCQKEKQAIDQVARDNMRFLGVSVAKMAVVVFVGLAACFGFFLKPDLWSSTIVIAAAVMLLATAISAWRNWSKNWKAVAMRVLPGLVWLGGFILLYLILVPLGLIQPLLIWGWLNGSAGLGYNYDESGAAMLLRLVLVVGLSFLGSWWYATVVHHLLRKERPNQTVPVEAKGKRWQDRAAYWFCRQTVAVENFIDRYPVVLYGAMAIGSLAIWLIPAGLSVTVNLEF